jgi:hypothetical protein
MNIVCDGRDIQIVANIIELHDEYEGQGQQPIVNSQR